MSNARNAEMGATRRSFVATGLSLPLIAHTAQAAPVGDPVLRTSFGPVKGMMDGNIQCFKGVRYGADTSLTRFQRPKPPTPWTQMLPATQFGSASPQRGDRTWSEDCLFLNVWTPAVKDGGARPIMVYFHGGAYNSGSGSDELYNGRYLAEKYDVVVVTVNHRLNAFGFLYLSLLSQGAFPDSGNAGMWDLVLALKWIKDNAVQMGGDAGKTFVFGQSGGGAKIATLMASPAAKNLFQAAATMSGQQVTASGPLNATERAKAYLSHLKIAPSDLNALLEAPAEQLIEALAAPDPINSQRSLYFGPVLDQRLISAHPFWPSAPVQSAGIPMILGNTKDETRNLIGRRNPNVFDLSWEELAGRLHDQLRVDIDPRHVVSSYRTMYPDYSPTEVFFSATTASRSWRGQVEEADARARAGHPTWVYQMNFPSPQDGGKWGAPHTIDIAHAFGNLTAKGSLTGNTQRDRQISDQLSGSFVALAKSGIPTHEGLSTWPEYSIQNRETMVFDLNTKFINDPRKSERELFATVPFTQWGT